MENTDFIVEFQSPELCFGPVRIAGAQGLGLPAGITAVVGPNGSGKTTLGYVIERGRFGFGNRVKFAREGMSVKMLAFTDIHSFTGVDVLRYDQRLESSENEYVPLVGEIFKATCGTTCAAGCRSRGWRISASTISRAENCANY